MQLARARLGAPAARALVAVVALAAGLEALAVAEGAGATVTYTGRSAAATVLTLAVGFGLVAAGLLIAFRGQSRRIGDLALLAGFVWFAPVLVGWQEGSPFVRSLAMVLAGFTVPLVVHLTLTYPSGRTGSRLTRAFVVVVYIEAALAALGLALVRDPYFDSSCWANCTANSFLVQSSPSLTHTIETGDRWFVAAAACAFIAMCLARLGASSLPARRTFGPIGLPAIAFAGAVIAHAIAIQRTTIEDPFDTALFAIFVVGSFALLLLAGSLIWALVHDRSERRAVGRIIANLDETPAPGAVQSALAQALGDADLRVAYWLPGIERYVDASGREVGEPTAPPERTLTRLTTNERMLAVVSHSASVPELTSQIGPAVRLGLENERLQAEALHQLEELRASQARIVETGDDERRRLERDLHDGAQQRLLALSYDLRLARAAAEADGDMELTAMLATAMDEAQVALAELRDLAHGIYPAILGEAGLAPALATLADEAPLPVELRGMIADRFSAPVETAAYLTAAEAIDEAGRRRATHVSVDLSRRDERLVIATRDDGGDRTSSLVHLADRIGALGGSLEVGATTLHAEIPCV